MAIFSMAIQYMREHLMETLNKQVTHVEESDVMFVITVPAIWSDASKQFMREVAIAVRWFEQSIKYMFKGWSTRLAIHCIARFSLFCKATLFTSILFAFICFYFFKRRFKVYDCYDSSLFSYRLVLKEVASSWPLNRKQLLSGVSRLRPGKSRPLAKPEANIWSLIWVVCIFLIIGK